MRPTIRSKYLIDETRVEMSNLLEQTDRPKVDLIKEEFLVPTRTEVERRLDQQQNGGREQGALLFIFFFFDL